MMEAAMLTADSKYAEGAFPKICSCGKVYSRDEWERLEFCFIQQPVTIGDEHMPALEGRLCPNHGKMGSHMTVRLRE